MTSARARPQTSSTTRGVEFTATFDLDNQCASCSYNGQVIGSGALFEAGWNPGTGNPQIANIDLFSTGATYYIDDITLTRLAGAPYQADTYDPNGQPPIGLAANINGVLGTSCAAARTSVTPGTLLNINVDGAPAILYDGIIDLGGALPRGAGAFAIPGTSQLLNVGIPGVTSPSALFLSSIFGAAPFGLVTPGTPFNALGGAIPAPTLPPGTLLVIQFAGIDFGNPEGFSTSQPCELEIL
jgi:hypothetical protein